MGMRLDVKHVGAVSKLHWARHCTVMAMFRRPQQRVDSEYTSFSEIGRDEEGRNFDSLYKILIIGDAAVGKTALLTRYCEGRFQTTYMSTVGIDYKTKVIPLEDESVKIQVWDTAGQERFRTLTNAYFRGAAGAILVYDVTSRGSFNNIVGWMQSVTEHGSPNIRIAIVGHKCDLGDERSVETHEGQKLADTFQCLFFEASSYTGLNCNKIFTRLAQEIKQAQEQASYVGHVRSSSLVSDGQLKVPTDDRGSSKCCN